MSNSSYRLSDNFVNLKPLPPRKVRNCKMSLLLRARIDFHQRLRDCRLLNSAYSSFNKLSHQSLYHWSTHDFFIIHFPNLTLNFSCWDIQCIEQPYGKVLFARGGRFDFHEYCRNSLQSIRTAVFGHTGVSQLVMGPTDRCARAFFRLQNKWHTQTANVTYFWMPLYFIHFRFTTLHHHKIDKG